MLRCWPCFDQNRSVKSTGVYNNRALGCSDNLQNIGTARLYQVMDTKMVLYQNKNITPNAMIITAKYNFTLEDDIWKQSF